MKTTAPKEPDKNLEPTNLSKDTPQKKASPGKPEIKPGRTRVINLRLPEGYSMIFDEFDDASLASGGVPAQIKATDREQDHDQDVSLDFVDELRDRERVTPGGPLIINLRLSGELRDRPREASISAKLKDYFISQSEEHVTEFNRKRRLGVIIMIAGIVSETLVANVFSSFFAESFISNILVRMFTLFGYGGFFFGIENVFDAYSERENLKFFGRISQAKVVFRDIESKPPKKEVKELESSIQQPPLLSTATS